MTTFAIFKLLMRDPDGRGECDNCRARRRDLWAVACGGHVRYCRLCLQRMRYENAVRQIQSSPIPPALLADAGVSNG